MTNPIDLTPEQIAQIAAAIEAAKSPSFWDRTTAFLGKYKQVLIGILIGFVLCFAVTKGVSVLPAVQQSEIQKQADQEAVTLPFPSVLPSLPPIVPPPIGSTPEPADMTSTNTCENSGQCNSTVPSGASSHTRYQRRLILRR